MIFKDRKEAGKLLADKLIKYKSPETILIAIPRGGVPVAYEIAKELKAPMDLALVKKIGHPTNKEYAIGAASLTDHFIVDHEQPTSEYITAELKRIRTRLSEMHDKFIGAENPPSLEGKNVIIIDDGIATGNSILATIILVHKSHPSKIIVAVPVASELAIKRIKPKVDDVIVLTVPDEFFGVGGFYQDFEQVTDEEVIRCFKSLRQNEH